ncbi:hypothetical protein RR46_00623 [Papilio xuthus]|uniref:Uncharacterized protein n=1 Tax=Papilio xuthus TaxID=66420 RepID=A0A0N1IBZ0_PAPXU|nr:hypothetical protein RR46_00623 [Papilio xuthus]
MNETRKNTLGRAGRKYDTATALPARAAGRARKSLPLHPA